MVHTGKKSAPAKNLPLTNILSLVLIPFCCDLELPSIVARVLFVFSFYILHFFFFFKGFFCFFLFYFSFFFFFFLVSVTSLELGLGEKILAETKISNSYFCFPTKK